MKRTLLTGTALATAAMLAASLAASPAAAEIKVGATMNFGMGFGNTDRPEAERRSRDGHAFSTNSEIHFKGSGKTDAGLEYGFTIEAEGDSTENDDDTDAKADASGAVDEASMFISGAFGKFILGQDDNAADPEIDGNVYPVNGQQGEDNEGMSGRMKRGATKAENNLTDGGDANMIMYQSPRFGGVAAAVSYVPEDGIYQALWGGNINTSHKFEGVGIKLSATGVLASIDVVEDKDTDLVGYTIGLGLDWEGFKFEVGYLREHNGNYESTFQNADADDGEDHEVFVIGAGYGQGPWAVNVLYTSADENISKDQWEAWSVGASYNIAKGLSVTAAALFADETDRSVGAAYDYQEYNFSVLMSF